MSNQLRFVDRLDDVRDHQFFLWFFVLGIAIMGLGRGYLDAPSWLISISLVSLLLLYAAAVYFTKRYHLREDRSADNLYFLGFLYTVSALIVSLVKFAQDSVGDEDVLANNPLVVVEDLGIGLVTTLVGLFLRVLFTQLRRDPNEIEEEVNLQLTVAAEKVTRNLQEVSRLVQQGTTIIGQVLDESRSQIEKQKDFMDEMFVSTRSDMTNANKSIVTGLKRLETRIDEVEVNQDLITAKLDPALSVGASSILSFSQKLLGVELPEKLFIERADAALPLDLFSKKVEPIFDQLSSQIELGSEVLTQDLKDKVEELGAEVAKEIEKGLLEIAKEITVLIGNLEVPPHVVLEVIQPAITQLDEKIRGVSESIGSTETPIAGEPQSFSKTVENLTLSVNEHTQKSSALIERQKQFVEQALTDGRNALATVNSLAEKLKSVNEQMSLLIPLAKQLSSQEPTGEAQGDSDLNVRN